MLATLSLAIQQAESEAWEGVSCAGACSSHLCFLRTCPSPCPPGAYGLVGKVDPRPADILKVTSGVAESCKSGW